MQIKPPSAIQAAASPQPHKAAAAGKSGDFAHLLKTAQADAPAPVPGTAATAPSSPTAAQARS